MQLNTFFPKELRITNTKSNSNEVYIYLHSNQRISRCPKCTTESNKVHSRYNRTLMDLPIIDVKLILIVEARKFFCKNQNCERKIFTERFQQLIESYARRTSRLKDMLRSLAFSSNGQTNERISKKFNFPTSGATFIRLIRATPVIEEKPNYVAIDDWAYKKGHTYGTIICNLETNAPVDVFPGRHCKDLEQWLHENSEIQIATRDRSISYKAALNNVCPNAMQVADRFHIINNILGTLTEYIRRNFGVNIPIKKNESHKEIPKDDHAAQRKAKLYDEVQIHRKNGMSIRAIAKHMKISTTTVSNYIHLGRVNIQ